MKKFVLFMAGMAVVALVQAQSPAPATHISFEVKPYKNQWVYLAYYYGGIKALADSAFLNADSKGVIKTSKPLPQGIYLLASPNKSILFEMMMGEDQTFSVQADTSDIEGSLKFSGSSENDLFASYTNFLAPRAKQADSLQQTMGSLSPQAAQQAGNTLQQLNQQIMQYRQKLMDEHPQSLLALMFKTLKNVNYPPKLAQPLTRQDTIAQYRFGKDHYWDDVDFMDGRLVRTPVFENKLADYLENWVSPEADSVIFEFNWMIALGRNDDEMFRYLISYFVDHYMYPKIMGQDKVFLHVYEQYLSGDKPKADFLNAQQMKIIRDRAYMLMANQLGTKAWDMNLPDPTGKMQSMYNLKAAYTIVAFWDVHCGKCKEDMPKMDTLFQQKWKAKNVQVYAVMVNESSLNDWKPFIEKLNSKWIHVHQPADMRAAEEKAGTPNFRQLYDMRSTPTLFLLDADKRIIAKNIGLNDLDKLLEQKFLK
ncbi:MAG: DUF5106 domain-containing protein [Chitinophagaceae bacterium]|nr:DUF5106 domain-containing protein [Chitinophagaceae bacterium]